MPISPPNYRGPLPFSLYCRLQKKFPQRSTEPDAEWLRRVAKHSIAWDHEFREELSGVIYRKKMDQIGMTRKHGSPQEGGPGLQQTRRAQREQARQYVTGPGAQSESDQDRAALETLIKDFDGRTPHNGSIFWNGISATKLAMCVSEWNRLDGVDVGQLEATTVFRFVNGMFEWKRPMPELTEGVSRKLGEAASGHITAVVMCGMRDDSVLTRTELPSILKGMTDELKAGQDPRITDISIVVIHPKHNNGVEVDVLTNNQIKKVNIVQKNAGLRGINKRADCTVLGELETAEGLKIPWQVRDWWAKRPLPEPIAATKVKTDFKKFWYGR